MKLTELIAALKVCLELHGDIEVIVSDDCLPRSPSPYRYGSETEFDIDSNGGLVL